MDFDRKDGFSYLDGVPIKIASRYCPPRPVTLPLAFDATLPSELLEDQYDFALEKQVLEFEQRRVEELEALKAREADRNVASKIESMSNISHGAGTSNLGFDPSCAPNNQNLPSWLSNSILQPQHQKQLPSKSAHKDEHANSSKKFNLSDFENDTSSPFDDMELQTINDLEELNSVFQGISNKQFPRNSEQTEDSVENSSHSEGLLPKNEHAGFVSKSISFPLPQNIDSENSSLQCPAALKTVPAPSSKTADSRLSFSYPSVSGLSSDTSTANVTVDLRNYTGAKWSYSALSQVPYITSYSDKCNTDAMNIREFSTPKTFLRGSKSYSDLHNFTESESCSVPKQDRSRTPPSTIHSSDVTETLIKKVFVNSGYSQGPLDDEIPSNGVLNCSNFKTAENSYKLPDPYDELDDSAKQIVDSITDMGFQQGQVARTVKHLGTDEKKVVEHLCQIQALEESGYDSLEAEAALHLHDYNKDEAKKFLDLVNQFQDLGFEKTAIKKALVQNKNDWNKTIDALLP